LEIEADDWASEKQEGPQEEEKLDENELTIALEEELNKNEQLFKEINQLTKKVSEDK